jgi:hypothetical protein
MSFKATWVWILIAGVLFGVIYFLRQQPQSQTGGPGKILPQLSPTAVIAVQVRPSGQGQPWIRAERRQGVWHLVEPLDYPAQSSQIDKLVNYLATLVPATYITPSEIRGQSDADEAYGFTAPQASLIVTQDNFRAHMLIGSRTPPGNQVYLKEVSGQGIYVVDGELLKLIPQSASDWRDRTLFSLEDLAFDRVAVTNAAKDPARTGGATFVLQREEPNTLWRMVWPFVRGARADNARIDTALRALGKLQVKQFVSDDPRADLESFGLAQPELELSLSEGTNIVAQLQVGRSPTNDAKLVYARRPRQNAVVQIDKQALALWQRASINDFRDPHLLTLTEPVDVIEARVAERFSLQYQTNGWRILPEDLPADPQLVAGFFTGLTNLTINWDFSRDVVNDAGLPEFGLLKPICEYLLKLSGTNASGGPTNLVVADIQFGFGTNQTDKVFARRADESSWSALGSGSVYAVATNDFARLPSLGWTLRDRKFWEFTEEDVARLTIHRQTNTWELVRNGPHQWSLAAGQGSINDLAVEEAVMGLARASADSWVARGETNRLRYGFADKSFSLIFELKSGQKQVIEFGGPASSGSPYAAIQIDGQLWICELPADLYRLVDYSLTIR